MRRILKAALAVFILIPTLACSISFNLTPTPAKTTDAPTKEPTLEPTVEKTITVYFTDQNKFLNEPPPFEVAVTRPLPEGVDPMRAVLDAFFAGPTAAEAAQGLVLVSSGFTGVSELTVENGIAHVHLEGVCANNGAAYSVAGPISRNLSQFPQITAIKIYDENDDTLDPDSNMSSLPYCLEP